MLWVSSGVYDGDSGQNNVVDLKWAPVKQREKSPLSGTY